MAMMIATIALAISVISLVIAFSAIGLAWDATTTPKNKSR